MSVISRRLPNSNITRHRAVTYAFVSQSNLPVGTVILNPATVVRLTDTHTAYDNGMNDIELKKAALNTNTPLKDAAINETRMFSSHFIQVFNLGVARGKYPAAHRSYYGLEVDDADVPYMGSEAEVMEVAGNLSDGDPQRIAVGGGLPMANPDITEVQAKATVALPLLLAQTANANALRDSQVALDALNVETDKVIKRVWDEVEAYFGELPAETKRAYAREWGVVYVTEGVSATLTGLVKNGANEPQEGVEVILVETGATAITNNEGRYDINTVVTGNVITRVTVGMPPVNYEATGNIPEDHEGIMIEMPDIVIP